MPFARSLRYALRIFCQAHNALQGAPGGGPHNEALVTYLERATKLLHRAPGGGPHNEALVTNLERATKLLHITPALLQSSDGRCSWQRRHLEYARGKLTGLIDWLVVFAGRSRQKARKIHPKLAEYERVS